MAEPVGPTAVHEVLWVAVSSGSSGYRGRISHPCAWAVGVPDFELCPKIIVVLLELLLGDPLPEVTIPRLLEAIQGFRISPKGGLLSGS